MARLKPGGRLAVISFHSLEDRIVKQFMNRHAKAPPTNRRLPELAAFVPTLDLIGGAIKAEDDELAVNPRSRSAVLRVAEKRGWRDEPPAAGRAAGLHHRLGDRCGVHAPPPPANLRRALARGARPRRTEH